MTRMARCSQKEKGLHLDLTQSILYSRVTCRPLFSMPVSHSGLFPEELREALPTLTEAKKKKPIGSCDCKFRERGRELQAQPEPDSQTVSSRQATPLVISFLCSSPQWPHSQTPQMESVRTTSSHVRGQQKKKESFKGKGKVLAPNGIAPPGSCARP